MTRRAKIIAISAVGVAVATCGLAFEVLSAGTSRRAETPMPSPDGTFTLIPFVNDGKSDPKLITLIGFELRDSKNSMVFRCQTIASDRMRWRMGWDDAGRIWLNSSDIGYLCWEASADKKAWDDISNPIRGLPIPASVKIER